MSAPAPRQPLPGPQPGWDQVERSAPYQDLRRRRRRFIAPMTVAYLGGYFGFLAIAGSAPGLLSGRVSGGLTTGFLAMAGVFAGVWSVVFSYLRASRRWDGQAGRVPGIADRAAAAAVAGDRRPEAGS